MASRWRHTERHRTDRIDWLPAAVLGANDGIVSTASLVLGVAAASADHNSIPPTGVAGGARMGLGAWRVGFWGALVMAITAGVGALFGAVV